MTCYFYMNGLGGQMFKRLVKIIIAVKIRKPHTWFFNLYSIIKINLSKKIQNNYWIIGINIILKYSLLIHLQTNTSRKNQFLLFKSFLFNIFKNFMFCAIKTFLDYQLIKYKNFKCALRK